MKQYEFGGLEVDLPERINIKFYVYGTYDEPVAYASAGEGMRMLGEIGWMLGGAYTDGYQIIYLFQREVIETK